MDAPTDNDNISDASKSKPESPTNNISPITESPNHISAATEQTSGIIKLPGFIDVNTHIRERDIQFRENFDSVTCAALSGGITMVCIMPNTGPAIVDEESLNEYQIHAKKSARCDYALHLAATTNLCLNDCNFATKVAGLKMYLFDTPMCTGLKGSTICSCSSCYGMLYQNMSAWMKLLKIWPKRGPGPICCHAQHHTIAAIMLYSFIVDRSIHICNVSKKEEILIIRLAKDRGVKVTCEVCPHHLFLSTADIDRIGKKNATLIPKLGSPEDQKALWDNIDYIDVFGSFHVPYTKDEKNSAIPPQGFPGITTILPLFLNAVNEGRLTLEDLKTKFYKNPKKIFNLPEQRDTYIEVNMNEEWVIPETMPFSKANWTPYAGMTIKGKVKRVVLRGELAFSEGEILVEPGYGKDVRNSCYLYMKCMK